jgi:hypothetical protein
MPHVIAAIGYGLAALFGTTVTAATATVIGLNVVLTGASIGLSFVSRALIGHPKLPDFSHDAASQTVTARQAVAPRRVLIGRNRVGGVLTFISTSGTNNQYLHLVITLSGHQLNAIGTMYFDGVAVPYDADQHNVTGNFAGFVYVERHLGDPADTSQPFPGLFADLPAQWTANHLQRGCGKVRIRLTWDQNKFPNGVPNITFDVQGGFQFDPRSSTTIYSENPALAIRDVLTSSVYGLGCASSEIDDATFISAANTCDSTVTLRAGGSINRFTCNGNFETSQQPGDTLKQMLSACGGSNAHLVYIGGKWSLFVAAYRSPTVTLTDDDFTGPLSVSTRLSKRDTCNAVKGVFVSALNNWQPSDFPPFMEDSQHGYGSDQWLIEDANERIYRDITLPFTIDTAVAQRLAKIELERTRRQIQVKCKVRLTGYLLQPGDVVNVTHSRFGWSSKTFEVLASRMTFEDNGGVPLLGVELELRETDSSIYNWTPASDELTDAAAPSTTLPNPGSVVAPTSLALATVQTTRFDGLAATYIQVTWTAPADQFVSNGGKIFVQYRQHGTTPWLTADIVDGTTVKVLIDGVAEATAYDVRIWSQNVYGSNSAVVEQDNFTVGSNTAYYTGGVIGRSFGKNLLGNPSFEQNVRGTPVNTNLSAGQGCGDEWIVQTVSAYHLAQLDNNTPRSGAQCVLLQIKDSVTIPADSVQYEARVVTEMKIPTRIGDIVRIHGYRRWDNNASFGSLTITQALDLLVYAADDTELGAIGASVVGSVSGSYIVLQGAGQIPATLSGKVPAYIRVRCLNAVKNATGTPFAIGAGVGLATMRFDDLSFVTQATPFDLTPTSTTGTPATTTNPLTQSGATATINVAATTWQFGDGQVSYNAGSVTPPGTGTYYVYADDPTYSGGAVTYQASALTYDTVAAPGRVYFGVITTVGGGGGTGTGGGTGGGGPHGKNAL